MRLKLSVLLGCPPQPQHNPETAADHGDLGDTLIESASLAWLINPAVFPQLNPHGKVECFIDKRLFSLFGTGAEMSAGQVAELKALGRRLMGHMGYGAAVAGVYDLDRDVFMSVVWVCHRDVVGMMKFLACGEDPVQTRLLSRLSPGGSLLEAPGAEVVRRACSTDAECGVVLGRVATVFERCERYTLETAQAALTRAGVILEHGMDGSVEVLLTPGASLAKFV